VSEKVGEPVSGKTSVGSPAEVMDEPTQPAEPTAEAKKSRGLGRCIKWASAVVMLYLLSYGPVARMYDKGMIGKTGTRVLKVIYEPIGLAYDTTPLKQPIGMYLHLWCPKHWDSWGNEK
jgi:hypothetical protein